MRKISAGLAAIALTASTLAVTDAIMTGDAASAATDDGALSLRVVVDADRDRAESVSDAGLEGVEVAVTDANGESITLKTDANGYVELAGAGNPLIGGQYRVEVANPDDARYTDAQLADGGEYPSLAPTTSFVDLSGGQSAQLAVGFDDRQSVTGLDATVYSAVHPESIRSGEADGGTEVYAVPYDLSAEIETLTTEGTVGAAYGVGIDPAAGEVYLGAHAKRGSSYSAAGTGAIHRVDPATGAVELYATVADAGDTPHAMGEQEDIAFRAAVGREGLGDVDISDDGRWLTTVNMNTDSLVVFPVQDAVDPAPVQTLAVPDQGCAADWAPMGLGTVGDAVFVGAVCGGDLQGYLLEYTQDAEGQLAFVGVAGQSDLTTIPGRDVNHTPNSNGGACNRADWQAWADDLPADCVQRLSSSHGGGDEFTFPQPLIADIVEHVDGRLLVSFRDRAADQYGGTQGAHMLVAPGESASGIYDSAGDVLFACAGDGGYEFGCGGDLDDSAAGFHSEAAFGGIAYLPGAEHFLSNQMDPADQAWKAGIHAYSAETGDRLDTLVVSSAWSKAAGLADLEVLVEKTQQIGNRVWIDTDADGIQDGGEPPVSGVQVSLFDAAGELVARTETDADGAYSFATADGLAPNTEYEIRLDRAADYLAGGPLEGYRPTATAAGENPGVDSDGVVAPLGDEVEFAAAATVTSPAPGENDHSIDFGFTDEQPVCSLGDVVWLDSNGNGIQDDGEPPVPGVTVTLLDADGEPVEGVEPQITDENGTYSFAGLECGEYAVQFVDPEGRDFTTPNAGEDDAIDSDADENGITAPVVLGGERPNDDPTVDAGLLPKAELCTIGDFVWVDGDGDGVQDAGEQGTGDVTVELLDEDGNVVAETVTASDGSYLFEGVECGSYRVRFTLPNEGFDFTVPGVGDDPAVDSNAEPTDDPRVGVTPIFEVTPEEGEDLTIDAGLVPDEGEPAAAPVCTVGDVVWSDDDGDGIQDAGEAGVEGVVVELLDGDGNVIAETVTDENGAYLFEGVECAEYQVRFTAPKGFDFTVPGVGDDPAVDSNADLTDDPRVGVTPVFEVTPEEGEDLTIDAGLVPDEGDLAATGADGEILAAAGAAGILFLLAGAVLAALRRRQRG
ncbi:SdrD B-like domain-containing protein [Microbacterium suaedae]|uniref:SdrD B-like domain-containing protein n=1 Tax=Microbacterium suaedae TaxID=2067813 RepID=UPI0013A6833D|nr:SdrD B-like domain-containing protein [Microbacterium suaedae]